MRLFFGLLIFCGANLISYFSYSQINSFPYLQEFESDFLTGTNVEFLPFWTGNEVRASSRIFRESRNMKNGTGALGISPTSTFSGIIDLTLDLSSLSSPYAEVNARSLVNGTGSYSAVMEWSCSIDEGISFSSPIKVGEFSNSNSDYQLYSYNFPSEAMGKSKVILRIKIKRGTSGAGTTAKVLMDDFKIMNGEISPEQIPVPPQEIAFREIQINEIFVDPTGNHPPDSLVLPNVEFVELYNVGTDTVNLNDFTLSNSSLPDYVFLPNSYVILCPANYVDHYSTFGSAIGLNSWNTLTNAGEPISLKDATGKVIDSLTYNLNWYGDENKQDGGWSLEQINPFIPCLGGFNWLASQSSFGATPGFKNSVYSILDTTSIVIENMVIKNNHTLNLQFNKPISDTLALSQINIKPYLEIQSFIQNGDLFEIHFLDSIQAGQIYEITLSDLKDCSHHQSTTKSFFGLGATPSFNDLLITEIMADPTPSQGLPDAEYIEIYNTTNQLITTKGISLADNTSFTSLPEIVLAPHQYGILCSASSAPDFKGVFVIVPDQWLSLNNSGETLSLTLEGKAIFSISYSNSWYATAEMKEGGYSLEMANTDFPCVEEDNWFGTLNEDGGTPGKHNSTFESRLDLVGPSIKSVEIVSDSSIRVSFDEKVLIENITKENFLISSSTSITAVKWSNPFNLQVELSFSAPFLTKTLYNISAKNISDCVGNVKTSSAEFLIPEPIDSSDIIINELLFNPRPNGSDFVELYNRSDKFLSLTGIKVARMVDDKLMDVKEVPIDKAYFAPGEYLVLTEDEASLMNEYPRGIEDNMYTMTLPPFPDEEGSIVLLNKDTKILDVFNYNEDEQLSFLKSKEGVSLERINPNAPTNSPSNWHSASSDVGFATPGKQNSQSMKEVNFKDNFKIEPQIFSPDGDGYNDFTMINYSFENPGNITSITLYDKEGRAIKNLTSNQTLSKEGFIQWNGEDEKGNKTDPGIYIIYIEMFNMKGEKNKIKKEVVVASKF